MNAFTQTYVFKTIFLYEQVRQTGNIFYFIYLEENYLQQDKQKSLNNIITLSDIQNNISNDSTVVTEYLPGKNYLYIYSISKDSCDFVGFARPTYK